MAGAPANPGRTVTDRDVEPKAPAAPGVQPRPGEDSRRVSGFNGSRAAFLADLLAIQCEVSGASRAVALEPGREGDIGLVAGSPPTMPVPERRRLSEPVVALLNQKRRLTQVEILPLEQADGLYGGPPREHLVVVPAGATPPAPALAFLFEGCDQAELERVSRLLELTVAPLTLFDAQQTLRRREEDLNGLATSIQVLETAGGHRRFREAAMALCNEVASRWGSERVSLGVLRGRYVKLQAMSGTEHVVRKMRLVQDLEAAMEECLDQDTEIFYPAPQEAPYVCRATTEFSKAHGGHSVCALPLRRDGKPLGVLFVERSEERGFSVRDVEILRLACDLMAPRLLTLAEEDRWFGARAATAARRGLATLVGVEHTWAKVGAVGLLAAILFLTLVHGANRVEAPFVVEPVVQQTVPAPFEGYLASVEVEPGDVVEAGVTILGRLDTADLRLQLAQEQAEIARFHKEADVAWREGDTASRQIALAKARQAEARAQWVEHQLARAALVAPVSGIVLEGDLKKELGRPVERGQPLFEVAPLEDLRVTLYVSEDRVGDLEVGDRGELAPASHPGQRVGYVVERVYPLAEVVNGRNVFRVRAKLEADALRGWMRPGVEGVAKTDVGEASYAWLWTREAVNWVRMQLWI